MSKTTINHPGEPTFLAISELTMKMPDPIIDPATKEITRQKVYAFLRRLFSFCIIDQCSNKNNQTFEIFFRGSFC
jgi:hypothetical protein